MDRILSEQNKIKTKKSILYYCGLLCLVITLMVAWQETNIRPAWADEVNLPKVMVGGQSIGIILQTQGATVVGFAPVITESGSSESPAKTAGLEIGDFITKINGQTITTDDEIGQIIDQIGKKGQAATVTAMRKGKEMSFSLKPTHCADTDTWRVGLYIRDNTAGVGTLTYYDPQTNAFGALGHLVADLEDKTVKNKDIGSILPAEIQDIKPGRKGEPGEKIGVFTNSGLLGKIYKNCDFGIFGQISSPIDNILYPAPISMAAVDEVKIGPAKIVTVVSGDKLEQFDIEITKLIPQHKSGGKGMVIKVTDPRLLKTTGGIVQGMSGSPIIQNGKLAGAVTHVFVNDPTSGYGCFAQWMQEQANTIL